MRTGIRYLVLAYLAFGAAGASPAAAQDAPKKEHSAVKPVPRDAKWMKRHEKFTEMAGKGGIELLFLGDSITDAWGGEGHNPKAAGAEIFEEEFRPMKAANFGIGGDRTQHVLWRLQNGELEGISPKVVMLMIGTNNSNRDDNTAEEIAEGVTAIVREIHKRSPKTKVLLLGIFPRGAKPNPQREKIAKANAIISKLDDGGRTVKYLDIGEKFLEPDGSISKEIMPDYLHLSPKGYRIWADAVKGPIRELMGEKD
ncbi:MAG TPA: platelet-activating factor acetylhydrolase IB subunit [Gemmataceae bacterium]